MTQPIRKVVSANRQKNNGGTIFYGNPAAGVLGSNGTDRQFIGVGLTYAGFHNDLFTYLKDVAYVQKAHTNANISFAKMNRGDYVMTGLFNTKLNRRSAYGASFPGQVRGRNFNFNIRTRKIVTAGWNYFTGRPLTTPTLSHDSFIRSGSATIDNRLVPGKIVWMGGTLGLPTRNNYAEKTG